MFKQLFFLHKSENDKALPHFKDVLLNHFKQITNKNILLAKVDSNLLLDQKYSYYFEVEFESKDKMDELMNSSSGKLISRALMDYHQIITIINIDFNNVE